MTVLRAEPLDDDVIALFDRMLRHSNYHVKWELLLEPPRDERLIGGMFHVLGEKWGWQEKAAKKWLARFRGTPAYEASDACGATTTATTNRERGHELALCWSQTATTSSSSSSTRPTTSRRSRSGSPRRSASRAAQLPALELRKRSIDARRGRVRFHFVVGVAEPAPPLGGAAAARDRRARRSSSSATARRACSAPTSWRAPGIALDRARSRQAGAAAPPRPQGPDAARPRRPRQQLLLRRGRRRHVLRRQALHARAQARRRARRDRDPRAARRAGDDPRRRAAAHRLEQAAEGDHRACASGSSRVGGEFRFGARVDRAASVRDGARDRRACSPTAAS